MKFLIDVNASRSLGNRLVAKGYDVAYVSYVDPKMVDDTTWKVSIFKQDSNNVISLKQYLCSISRVPNL